MYSGRNSLKILGIFVVVSQMSLLSKPAAAVSLEFAPASQTVNIGNQVTVDVFASNPGDNLIGAYDFSVNYEFSVLTLNQVVEACLIFHFVQASHLLPDLQRGLQPQLLYSLYQ